MGIHSTGRFLSTSKTSKKPVERNLPVQSFFSYVFLCLTAMQSRKMWSETGIQGTHGSLWRPSDIGEYKMRSNL